MPKRINFIACSGDATAISAEHNNRRFFVIESPEAKSDKPSVIVVGPQGCGKTLNARALAKAFGLKHWCDAEDGPLPARDHLILAHETPRDPKLLRVVSFRDAIKKVARPHPATPR